MPLEQRKASADVTDGEPVGSASPPSDGPAGVTGKPGRVRRAAAWSKATATKAADRAVRERERHVSVDVGFRTAERQRRVAAMVLAGGIAYRIFFWLLAVSVVAGGVLGFFDPDAVETTLEQHGVTGWTASAVAQLTRSSSGNEVWLLLVGGWLVLWTGYTCSKALVLTHGTIWAVPPPRLDRPLRASLLFSGCTLGFIAALAAARYVREQDADRRVRGDDARPRRRVRLLAARDTQSCPNAATGWLDLVPGAVIVAVGLQAMHVFTVYFLGPKLESATQLYGVVGVMTTILFWFYLGGRLIVAAATLNVEFTEARAAQRGAAETD